MGGSVSLEEEKDGIISGSLPIDQNIDEKISNKENTFRDTEPPSPMIDSRPPNFSNINSPSKIYSKPKYNLKKLKKNLKKKLKMYGEMKYEELDEEITIIYSEWWSKKQSDFDLKAIKYFHPYCRISGQIDNIEDENLWKKYGDKFSDEYCERYNLIKIVLRFASKLVIKWKIGNLTSLLYRFSPKYGHTELLEMDLLAYDYFTVESLWLCIETDKLPEELGIDEETKILAKFYYDSALTVVNYLLKISEDNQGVENQNEESQSKLDGLCKINHSFKMPSMISRCFTSAYINPRNKILKTLIEELDFACRNFEERMFEILHDYYLSIKIDNDD